MDPHSGASTFGFTGDNVLADDHTHNCRRLHSSDSEGTQDNRDCDGIDSANDSDETVYYRHSDLKRMCSSCGAVDALRRCTVCWVARYCNRVCLKNHWHSGHHVNCQHLQYTRQRMAQARERLHQEVEDRLRMLRATKLV